MALCMERRAGRRAGWSPQLGRIRTTTVREWRWEWRSAWRQGRFLTGAVRTPARSNHDRNAVNE